MANKTMKNFIICVITAFLMVFCIQSFMASDANAASAKIFIDDKEIVTDVAPQNINSRVLVPIRVISEGLGAKVDWDNATRSITVKEGSDVIKMTANQQAYTKNGQQKTMDVPVKIINSRAMVPIRVVSEDLGAGVRWDNGKVYVQSNGPLIIKVNHFNDKGAYLNIRKGPGTNYPEVGKVFSDQYLNAITKTGDWFKIETKGGKDGYVSSQFVTIYSGDYFKKKPDTQPEPNPNPNPEPQPKPDIPGVTDDSNGTLSVVNRSTIQGQSSISLNVGKGFPKVVQNINNQLIIEIPNARLSTDHWQPAPNMAPFTGFKVDNYGSNAVRITANVANKDYFRVNFKDQEHVLTLSAVAKHKNGTLGLAGKVIVVAPGHGVYEKGGIDRGASSPYNGLDEVDFNTPIALKLRDKLQAAGATVIMIRDTEGPINMTLYERSVLANDKNADAFVELHGDSANDPAAHGIGTFVYSDYSDFSPCALTPPAQKDMRNEFGYTINDAVGKATGQPAYVKTWGNFSVIRETEVPCTLIECGFLTNKGDSERLATDAYQEKLAQGIFNGLNNYFSY